MFESVQEEGEARHLAIAWRACVITAGMYLFYVFETILHKLTQHCPHRVNSGDKVFCMFCFLFFVFVCFCFVFVCFCFCLFCLFLFCFCFVFVFSIHNNCNAESKF